SGTLPRNVPRSPYTTLFRSGVADLSLAREEREDVARSLRDELVDRLAQGRRQVALVAAVLRERSVADLDEIGAARDLDDRRGGRSEEHTSELQSRENIVCSL